MIRLKQNDDFAEISKIANREADYISNIVISELRKMDIIQDEAEYYGAVISDCICEEFPILAIHGILRKIGIANVTRGVFDAFMKCVVIGDGDCPECGGKMEYGDCITRQVNAGIYDLPPEYELEVERKRCPICGYEIEHDYRIN